jgi:uncharacterized protein with PIN domain
MKFLCDEMLKRLGQWLRVAGHDVLMLPDGTQDRLVIEAAVQQERLLLTRDRQMAQHPDAAPVVLLLECQGLEDCVADLNRRLSVDWLYRPFSRCLNCNTELVEADATQRQAVPPEALRRASSILYCPGCAQLYWEGSHVARMRERLRKWQRGAGS